MRFIKERNGANKVQKYWTTVSYTTFWESELPPQKFEINTSQKSNVSKYCYGRWVICRAPVWLLNTTTGIQYSMFQPETFSSSYTRWLSALTPTPTWEIHCYVLNLPVTPSEQALFLRDIIYKSKHESLHKTLLQNETLQVFLQDFRSVRIHYSYKLQKVSREKS